MVMTMMKNSIMMMGCILLFSSLADLTPESTFGPDKCCFHFYSRQLPKHKVVNYKYTDRLCSMAGVLFTMKSGLEICADPSTEWVKKIINAKENIQAKNVTTSAYK